MSVFVCRDERVKCLSTTRMDILLIRKHLLPFSSRLSLHGNSLLRLRAVGIVSVAITFFCTNYLSLEMETKAFSLDYFIWRGMYNFVEFPAFGYMFFIAHQTVKVSTL